jgi:hypothetical protein
MRYAYLKTCDLEIRLRTQLILISSQDPNDWLTQTPHPSLRYVRMLVLWVYFCFVKYFVDG